MQFSFKSLFQAAVAWLALCSPALSDSKSAFETALANRDAERVEAIIFDLDEKNIASGNTRNQSLRLIFERFSTTAPKVTELLTHWNEIAPDSIYRKTAKAWHLEHLVWIARGSDVSQKTHPKAFEQMQGFMQTSNALAWDVFKIRNDFVPASDLIAQSYLHNHGHWPMEDFAKVALTANPSPWLLNKIVLAANPKWGGSWEEISYFCETYANSMVTSEWYTVDGCKVIAIYHMASTMRGGNAAQVEWARTIMEKAPKTALIKQRRFDLFYLNQHMINPENADLAVSLYDPTETINARYFAFVIETSAGVANFSAEQEPVINAAEEARALRDPLNPDYIRVASKRIFEKYPSTLDGQKVSPKASRAALSEYIDYLSDVIAIAPYRPEAWASRGLMKNFWPGEYPQVKKGRADLERAVLLSNYDLEYVTRYLDAMHIASVNLDIKFNNGSKVFKLNTAFEDEPVNEITISVEDVRKDLECPIVRAARLTMHLCNTKQSAKEHCEMTGTLNIVDAMLNNARKLSYCPALMNAPLEYLAIQDTAGL